MAASQGLLALQVALLLWGKGPLCPVFMASQDSRGPVPVCSLRAAFPARPRRQNWWIHEWGKDVALRLFGSPLPKVRKLVPYVPLPHLMPFSNLRGQVSCILEFKLNLPHCMLWSHCLCRYAISRMNLLTLFRTSKLHMELNEANCGIAIWQNHGKR